MPRISNKVIAVLTFAAPRTTLESRCLSRRACSSEMEDAIAKAAETVHNLRWFQVVETRGHIDNQAIAHWQVTVKIGFTLDD